MFKFSISGPPQPKKRPRFTKFGRAYTPKQTQDYERHIINEFKDTYPVYEPLKCEVVAIINAYFPIPQSASKKQKASMIENAIRPKTKIDIDNVAKIVLDGLNGYAYDDDKQVVKLIAEKWYSDQPRIDVELYERVE